MSEDSESLAGSEKFSPKGWNDPVWAAVFVVHVFGVLAWVGYAVSSGLYQPSPGQTATFLGHRVASGKSPGALDATILLCHSLVFAAIWAGLWLSLLVSFPKPMVYASFIGLSCLFIALAGYAFMLGEIVGGVMCFIVALANAIFIYVSRDRIPFTANLIKEFIGVLRSYPSIFGMAFGMVACMVVWLVVWLVAFVGVALGGAGGLGMLFVLFLSFYWGCQVFSNVSHVITAGLAGRWYFSTQLDAPVHMATKHAWTYQFGSICLGSLLVAFIQAVRAIVNILRSQAEDSGNEVGQALGCIADCLLSCFESAMRMFNTFAFTIVAIYSVPFCRAGKEVMALMDDAGCEGVCNYHMVNVVTLMGALGAALLNAVVTAALAWRMQLEHPWVLGFAVLGFFMGFAVASVIGRLLESGTASLLTCWAMEPKTLGVLNSDLSRLFEEVRGFAAERKAGATY